MQYQKFKDSKNRSEADKVLETQALERLHASDASIGEKIAALGTAAIMGAKRKLGMSMKKSQTKKGKGLRRKRIIPTPKRGGFLPLLLPILGALGALGGSAAGIAKAVNDAKANEKQLAEMKRHNLVLESEKKGKGHTKNIIKKGKGLRKKNYQKREKGYIWHHTKKTRPTKTRSFKY